MAEGRAAVAVAPLLPVSSPPLQINRRCRATEGKVLFGFSLLESTMIANLGNWTSESQVLFEFLMRAWIDYFLVLGNLDIMDIIIFFGFFGNKLRKKLGKWKLRAFCTGITKLQFFIVFRMTSLVLRSLVRNKQWEILIERFLLFDSCGHK